MISMNKGELKIVGEIDELLADFVTITSVLHHNLTEALDEKTANLFISNAGKLAFLDPKDEEAKNKVDALLDEIFDQLKKCHEV